MSQADSQKKQIGEHVYEVFMLPPRTSQKLLIQLSKMVGPSLGPLFDKFIGKNMQQILNTEVDVGFFSRAFDLLFQNLDNENLNQVIDQLAMKTLIDGKDLYKNFDMHFMGRLDEMYQWLFFAAEVQWGKSLSALLSWIGSRGAMTGATKAES